MTIEEFVTALRDVDSATVSNAVQNLNVREPTEGYADLRLRRLVPQPEPMVGFAVTVMIDSTTPGLAHDKYPNHEEMLAAVRDSPKPCVVVCQEAGPNPDKGCHMGDVLALKLAQEGAVGVVSGSGMRDLHGIGDLGFSAFGLGTVVSHGVWTVTQVNIEVEVAGLRVRPGDLLHGNADGLVTVPTDQPERVLEQIEEIGAKEVASRALAQSKS